MSADHDRSTLPLPDFDHLPLGTLRDRIRSLDADSLQILADYERAHGDRLPVMEVLRQRLDAVRSGAQLSGGSPAGLQPESSSSPSGGSPVTPATSGPPMNPPSHGDPTNPAQPR
jgi:hypothetical protein